MWMWNNESAGKINFCITWLELLDILWYGVERVRNLLVCIRKVMKVEEVRQINKDCYVTLVDSQSLKVWPQRTNVGYPVYSKYVYLNNFKFLLFKHDHYQVLRITIWPSY